MSLARRTSTLQGTPLPVHGSQVPAAGSKHSTSCACSLLQVRDASVIPEEPEVVSSGDSPGLSLFTLECLVHVSNGLQQIRRAGGEAEASQASHFIHIEYKYVKAMRRRQIAQLSLQRPCQDRRQVKDCGPSIQWEELRCVNVLRRGMANRKNAIFSRGNTLQRTA